MARALGCSFDEVAQMPVSVVRDWLTFFKIEGEEQKAAHKKAEREAKAQPKGGKTGGRKPRGRRRR